MQKKLIAISNPISVPKESWKIDIKNQHSNIVDVEGESILYRQPTINCHIPKQKPLRSVRKDGDRNFSVTSLKGKMSPMSAEEIDNQIDDLRNEWDRGF